MKRYRFLLIILYFLSLTACDLLYPPQYYSQLVNKPERPGGSGGAPNLTWTNISLSAANFTAAAWGGGSFMISDNGGNIFTSLDGIHWSSFGGVLPGSYNSMAFSSYNGGTFYAVATNQANNSVMLTINAGTNWTAQTFTGMTNYGMIVTNGYVIVVGTPNANNIQVSPESSFISTWTPIYGSASPLYGICLGPGSLYYAVGDNGSVTHSGTSTPTSTWSSAQINGGLPSLRSICYNGTYLVAAGSAVTSPNFYYSSDGTTWTGAATYSSPDMIRKIIWVQSLDAFIAVGDNGKLLASPGGPDNWGFLDIGIPIPSGVNLIDIVNDGSRFVIVASNGSIYVSP